MLEVEEFAMRMHILSSLAAGAAALAIIAKSLPAEARPLGSGWSTVRAGAGWGGARKGVYHGYRPRFRYGGHGYRHKFTYGDVAVEPGLSGGRYLSDDSWFLSDFATYLSDEPTYRELWSPGYGYGYPAYAAPARHAYRPPASYAVPVHLSPHARRVVTVHRGGFGKSLHRAAFRPGRHVER
jgi:hypothetical protein